MYIDTHAHLNFKAFNNDWQEVIERAKEAGVSIINVGSNLKTSQKAIEIAKNYKKGVYAAIGLHPIHVKDEDFDENKFLEFAKDPKVVAIGETGLDYYAGRKNIEQQKEIFYKLIRIAGQVNKPIIVHNRDAGEDVMSVLLSLRNPPKGVMHCFAENWQYAKLILDLGMLISFTGLITFTKNTETLRVVKDVPLERLMIETDSPFMTPEKYRPARNEPAYVIEIAKKMAEIKKIPLEKVAKQTTENAKKLFKLTQF